MKAILIQRYGGVDAFTEEDIALPHGGPEQVVVEVHAASVNPVDANIRAGLLQDVFPVESFPHVLGIDIAGVVLEVGKHVTHLKEGDRVFGLTTSGGYAEYALANGDVLTKMPDEISFNEAGALPAVALTAIHSLFHYGNLQAGEKVLIHAGAGGVGHVAVQMAKAVDAYVIATASTANLEFVKKLGADEVIDYTATDFTQQVKDIDLVLDSVIGENQQRNVKILKQGGRIVSIVHPDIAEQLAGQNINAKFVVVNSTRDDLQRIVQWVREQKLKVFINRTFPLSVAGLAEAHQRIETKRARGKLVVQVRD